MVVGWLVQPGKALSDDNDQLVAAIFLLPPWGMIDQQDNLYGVTVEQTKLIARESGLNIILKAMPYKRMFRELEEGAVDFAIFYRSGPSEAIAHQLAHVYNQRNIVVGLKGLDLKQYDDIKSVKIGQARGVYYERRFDNDLALNKYITNDHTQSVQMLLKNRLGAIVGPEGALHYTLKQQGQSKDILGEPFVLGIKESWVQFSKKSDKQHLIAPLITASKRLRDNGAFDEIMTRWFD